MLCNLHALAAQHIHRTEAKPSYWFAIRCDIWPILGRPVVADLIEHRRHLFVDDLYICHSQEQRISVDVAIRAS